MTDTSFAVDFLLCASSAVVARPFTSVRHPKSLVDAECNVKVDDEYLKDEVEEVVAPLGVEPGWLVPGARRLEGCAGPESGAENEDDGRSHQHHDLGLESANAKLLNRRSARSQPRRQHQRERQERNEENDGRGGALDSSVDIARVLVEGVKLLDDRGDGHDQHEGEQSVEHDESFREELIPSNMGVGGSEDALGEEEVDDE